MIHGAALLPSPLVGEGRRERSERGVRGRRASTFTALPSSRTPLRCVSAFSRKGRRQQATSATHVRAFAAASAARNGPAWKPAAQPAWRPALPSRSCGTSTCAPFFRKNACQIAVHASRITHHVLHTCASFFRRFSFKLHRSSPEDLGLRPSCTVRGRVGSYPCEGWRAVPALTCVVHNRAFAAASVFMARAALAVGCPCGRKEDILID